MGQSRAILHSLDQGQIPTAVIHHGACISSVHRGKPKIIMPVAGASEGKELTLMPCAYQETTGADTFYISGCRSAKVASANACMRNTFDVGDHGASLRW